MPPTRHGGAAAAAAIIVRGVGQRRVRLGRARAAAPSAAVALLEA